MNLDNNLKPIINAIKKIIPLKEAYYLEAMPMVHQVKIVIMTYI